MPIKLESFFFRALFAGLLIWYACFDFYQFSSYFYEKPVRDYTAVFFLFILGISLGYFFLRRSETLQKQFNHLLPLIVLLALLSSQLVHLIYSYTNYSYLIFYFCFLLLGMLFSSLEFKSPSIIAALLLPGVLFFPLGVPISISSGIFLLILIPKVNQTIPAIILIIVLLVLNIFIPEINYRERQKLYHDKVIYSASTPLHEVDITEWKKQYWFFYNNRNQFSTIDYPMYYEPFAFIPFTFHSNPKKIAVIGGENGLLIQELLKKSEVEKIKWFPVDSLLSDYLSDESNPFLSETNLKSIKKIEQLNGAQPGTFLETAEKWDLIYLDISDPEDLFMNQFYTQEFYQACRQKLEPEGVLISQSLSPYLSPNSFEIIKETLRSAGLEVKPFHNQVPTIGEWSWVMASDTFKVAQTKQQVLNGITTKWLNESAFDLVLSFGKSAQNIFPVNTLWNPILMESFIKEGQTSK